MENSNNNNKKTYYSVNLTEGRIWAIFILFLLIISVITFTVVIIMKNNAKKSADFFSNSSSSSSMYFDYHEKLGIEEKLISPASDVTADSKSSSSNIATKPEIVVKEEQQPVEKKVDIADNSEVVYSSKYIEKDNKKVNFNDKKTSNVIEKKRDETKIEKNQIRYAVQVGSYEEKKRAEEIAIYYKMLGYPTYVEEKSKNGKIYYRLRVGPFKEKANAEKYLATLKSSKYGKESMIWEFKL